MVFWSRWRAVIREQLGLRPRGENCKPPWAVKKLSKEMMQLERRREHRVDGERHSFCPSSVQLGSYVRLTTVAWRYETPLTRSEVRGCLLRQTPPAGTEEHKIESRPFATWPKKWKTYFLQYVDSLERRKFTELLPALTEAAMPHLSPALGWCNPSHSHVYVATSGAVVRRQGTRQHSRVRVCQRSLRKKNF